MGWLLFTSHILSIDLCAIYQCHFSSCKYLLSQSCTFPPFIIYNRFVANAWKSKSTNTVNAIEFFSLPFSLPFLKSYFNHHPILIENKRSEHISTLCHWLPHFAVLTDKCHNNQYKCSVVHLVYQSSNAATIWGDGFYMFKKLWVRTLQA